MLDKYVISVKVIFRKMLRVKIIVLGVFIYNINFHHKMKTDY